ncbi:thioesterase [Lentzea tibetensis]|uniref:Thioesterase n=1 Tax=Lentzea tibetensis TaxID=2591470 RepID=A0A563F226_9PSEU|nr:alpha/beta fold hydrolase [Lentzea tibetensis]TWP53788.1 thioesterase [Lentzea tibetensis]
MNLLTPKENPDAPVRLVCFPNAGSGAAAYRAFAPLLAPEVELTIVRLPGREARIAEEPHRKLGELVPALADELAPCLDVGARRLAFFGHSMGALVAFELARHLRRTGARLPDKLVVSGRPAPHVPYPPGYEFVHDLPEDRLVRRLRGYAGTPDELLADPELLRMFLPTLRADFEVVETYRHHPEPRLPCDIAAYGGRADEEVPPATVASWAEHTSGAFRLRLFDGGHFYLDDARSEVAKAVLTDV